nr:MAG: hypothetical protein H3Bulk42582_000002 [Mitovirus sp.]
MVDLKRVRILNTQEYGRAIMISRCSESRISSLTGVRGASMLEKLAKQGRH